MSNIQTLQRNFDRIYTDYSRDSTNYNIQTVATDTFNSDISGFAHSLPTDINNILTTSVINEFLKSKKTIFEIINLYTQIYNYAISQYIESHLDYNLQGKIQFVLNGGMAMLFTLSSIVYGMPKIIADHLINKFITTNFKKSDILKPVLNPIINQSLALSK